MAIGPYADVVRLEAEADSPLELERLDVGPGELQAPRSVEHGELL